MMCSDRITTQLAALQARNDELELTVLSQAELIVNLKAGRQTTDIGNGSTQIAHRAQRESCIAFSLLRAGGGEDWPRDDCLVIRILLAQRADTIAWYPLTSLLQLRPFQTS